MYQHGLGNVYRSSTDYFPLYHYVLYLYGLCQGSLHAVASNISYLKLITLSFHLVTGFVIVLMLLERSKNIDSALVKVLFYLFNVAVLYNAAVWGQVDDILTCFVFLSLFFAYRKRVLLSLLLFVLAVNFKLQAIVFLPVLGLMLLPIAFSSFSIRNLAVWILVPTVLQLMIVLPFVLAGTMDGLSRMAFGSVGKYPVVSMNAYNIWDFLLQGDLMNMSDATVSFGLTYRSWGLLMFFLLSGIALFPLFLRALHSVFNRMAFDFPLDKLLVTGALIPLLFFYLNTQMHERYVHPMLPFLIAFSLITRKPFVSIIGCLAYFLNMEGVFRHMQLPNYGTVIFDRDFISFLYLILIGWLYVELYKGQGVLKQLISMYPSGNVETSGADGSR